MGSVAVSHGWDLPRSGIKPVSLSCVARWILNHWTTRKTIIFNLSGFRFRAFCIEQSSFESAQMPPPLGGLP